MTNSQYKIPIIKFNVITQEECDYIKNKSEPLLLRNERVSKKFESAKLSHSEDSILKNVISKITTTELSKCEELEVLRFKEGDFIKPMCEGFINKIIKTYYIPLVDYTEYEGGELLFEYLNRMYKLPIGSVISFDTLNEDGNVPFESEYSHEQVKSGEKWFCKLCIRENEITSEDENFDFDTLNFSQMTLDDIDEIKRIELSVYSASSDVPGRKFTEKLINECPDLTLVIRYKGKIFGAMYGGLINGIHITNEIMNTGFYPDGDTVMVCSICVPIEIQGLGIGRKLGDYYYNQWILNGKNGVSRPIKYFSTVVQECHIEWTESLGFENMGKLNIDFSEPVYNMVKKI